MNFQRLAGLIGILRIITIVLGLLVLILTGIYRYQTLKEQLFFSVVIILFFTSIILLIILLLDLLQPPMANSVDMSFHLIGGLILFLATALMLYSVCSIGDPCYFFHVAENPCPNVFQPYVPRILLCVLALINGLVYILAGILIKRREYI